MSDKSNKSEDSDFSVDKEDNRDYNKRLRDGFFLLNADEDPEGYEQYWS